MWKGYDGSEIYVRRHFELYNSPLGKAAEKIERLCRERSESPLCILWGVGNHGGGPSEKDISDIDALAANLCEKGDLLIHSDPDRYFAAVSGKRGSAPVVARSLRHCNTGCYSSMSAVKSAYRKLERELFLTEKICSVASLKGLMEYPSELAQAERDMLFMQFHDVLPGTVIKQVETASLRTCDHALEILARLKTRAYFALCNEIGFSEKDCYPVLVYNPLPYAAQRTVEVEFQLADQNWEDNFTYMHVFDKEGKKLPSQIEKESSNLNLDWRKHVVFNATLEPCSVNVFVLRPYKVETRPQYPHVAGKKTFYTKDTAVTVDFGTGLITSFVKDGTEYLTGSAFVPAVYSDNEDPWAMSPAQDKKLGEKIGEFSLLSPEEGSVFSGVKTVIPSCRIIEDGDVRTVVEAVFGYGLSRCLARYTFNRSEGGFTVSYKVFFSEKDKCLKVEIPVKKGTFAGRQAFGREVLRDNGGEDVFSDWCGVFDGIGLYAINDGTYSGSYDKDKLCLTLLRTPAYTGHPINDRDILRSDRYTDRIDIGERDFRFRMDVGSMNDAEDACVVAASQPTAFSFFPRGGGKPQPFMNVSGAELVSMRKTEKGYELRLYNGHDEARTAHVVIPSLGLDKQMNLKGFEFGTLVL